MIWSEVNKLPENIQSRVLKWKCPNCGSKCLKVGLPEIEITSRYVNGGEFNVFECVRGCIIQPKAKEFSR